MQNKELISTLISQRVPAYQSENAPQFVQFIKDYYEYCELSGKSVDTVRNHARNLDVDKADDLHIEHFLEVYGKHIPKTVAYDKRLLIKLLNKIYAAKGTETALKILFQVIFNKTATITYPSQQILRASDGVWIQYYFVTLQTLSGLAPRIGEIIILNKDQTGQFIIGDVEQIDVNTYRVYFKSVEKHALIAVDDLFYISRLDETDYSGKVILSPIRLDLVQSGKYWKAGQIFTVPGTLKDTIVQVDTVTADGSILTYTIIQYGYTHIENQQVIVTPFFNKPNNGYYDISFTQTGAARAYTLRVYDYTDSVTDKFVGWGELYDQTSYVLDTIDPALKYMDYGYVISRVATAIQQSSSITRYDYGMSQEMWLESFAEFTYRFGPVGKTHGYWSADNGQLSNSFARLHDSYFYQMFSYLVETELDISDYKELMKITHPIGMKQFSLLSKTTDIDLSVQILAEKDA